MKAINIARFAVVVGSIVVTGAHGAAAFEHDTGLASRLEADKPVDMTGLVALEAVTSDELDRTNGSDPANGILPIPASEARGADLSLKPLNTAPTSTMFRVLPAALSTAN